MRQPPLLKMVQDRMRPGLITRDGFLGTDRRQLLEILEEDQNTVSALGLRHEQICHVPGGTKGCAPRSTCS
ncbi:MAG: hypothetical protein ACYS8L_03845 [Planctomycetota bacterium]|jgi:hypothetical protein